jgi:hypothetical protein
MRPIFERLHPSPTPDPAPSPPTGTCCEHPRGRKNVGQRAPTARNSAAGQENRAPPKPSTVSPQTRQTRTFIVRVRSRRGGRQIWHERGIPSLLEGAYHDGKDSPKRLAGMHFSRHRVLVWQGSRHREGRGFECLQTTSKSYSVSRKSHETAE